jgi:hypothetical protein
LLIHSHIPRERTSKGCTRSCCLREPRICFIFPFSWAVALSTHSNTQDFYTARSKTSSAVQSGLQRFRCGHHASKCQSVTYFTGQRDNEKAPLFRSAKGSRLALSARSRFDG